METELEHIIRTWMPYARTHHHENKNMFNYIFEISESALKCLCKINFVEDFFPQTSIF